MEPMAEQRGRLAMMEDQLAVLQARYELSISAFKFDEANTLQRKIAALEAERLLEPSPNNSGDSPEIAQLRPPAEQPRISYNNDFAGADIDRIARHQAKRYDFATVDHPVAELANLTRILCPGPADDIAEI